MKTEQSMKSSRLSTDINNTNSRPKLEEEKPSLPILAYGLSNRCLNILFKKGVFTS